MSLNFVVKEFSVEKGFFYHVDWTSPLKPTVEWGSDVKTSTSGDSTANTSICHFEGRPFSVEYTYRSVSAKSIDLSFTQLQICLNSRWKKKEKANKPASNEQRITNPPVEIAQMKNIRRLNSIVYFSLFSQNKIVLVSWHIRSYSVTSEHIFFVVGLEHAMAHFRD